MSKLGQELRLNALSGTTLSFDTGAELHVRLPFDIAVGSFHLSDLGLTPTLRLDSDNLFTAPPVVNPNVFQEDLMRAGLALLTTDLNFLVGDGQQGRPNGVLRQLVTGAEGLRQERHLRRAAAAVPAAVGHQ